MSAELVSLRTLAERRALVGKKVRFFYSWSGHEREGVVEAVRGKNIRVSGEWLWAPMFNRVRVIPAEVSE